MGLSGYTKDKRPAEPSRSIARTQVAARPHRDDEYDCGGDLIRKRHRPRASTATARRAVGRTTRGVVGAAAVNATSASLASGSMPGPRGRGGRGGERIIGSVTKGGGGASSLDSPSSDGGSKTGGAIGASTGRGRVGGVR